jgi:polygalacturonase
MLLSRFPIRVSWISIVLFGLSAATSRAVSVKDFGAKGDGQTDDTAALMAAVEGAKDGVVEFTRGSYRITRTIDVTLKTNGPVGLIGRGGSAKIIMAGEGPAFRFLGTHATGSADPNSVQPGVWANERMPLIDTLEIVGENAQADGIEVTNTLQPVLRAVLIRQVRHGIHFTSRNRNVLVAGCHIYDCRGFGIFMDAVNIHQMNISDSHISYCRQGGIKIAASEIRNLQITGNDIEYNCDPQGPPAADIWIDSSQRSSVREGTISGNTIQAILTPGGANIRFTGPTSTPDKVGLFSISGNHISTQEVNIHLDHARGVSISGNNFVRGFDRHVVIDGSRNVVVSGNVFDRNPDYFTGKPVGIGGISMRGSRGIIFSDNIVDGAEYGSAEAGGAITIAASREVTINGCHISNPKFRGIAIEGGANVRVTNCSVSEDGTSRMLAAVEITGSTPGTVVQGNSFGRGKNGDVVNRGSGATVEGNRAVEVANP